MSRKIIFILLAVMIAFLFVFVMIVSAQLADTPWPMFHHDVRHTGQSPYLGAQTNDLKWNYSTGKIKCASPTIGLDGSIYIAAHYLYALNPNGSLKWRYEISPLYDVWGSPAIGSDGTIYVGSDLGYIYAINPNGSLQWRYHTLLYTVSSPAIGSDGTIYMGAWYGWDSKLYAIYPNGSLKWEFVPTGIIDYHCSPAIGLDGTIYVGASDKLYAVNPNGSLKWSRDWGYSSPAIDSDGTVYVKFSKDLYALNPNGSMKWIYNVDDEFDSSATIGSDGTIYIGSRGYNKLYAINPNGSLKWSFSAGDRFSSSAVTGSDGTIYIGSNDNKFYAINPDGSLKWSYETGGSINYASAAIDSDGTVYMGSWDGNLYAIGGISGLVFITPTQTITVGEPSNIITIQTQDASGNSHPVGENTTINLKSSSATGKFSLSKDPWIDITLVTIPAGNNSVSFYYKDTTVGTLVITASEYPNRAWTDAQQTETIEEAPTPTPPVPVPAFNAIGLLVLIGILAVILASMVIKKK